MKNNKKVYLEIMRIIAILFVIYSHTNSNGYFLFSKYSSSSIFFWINLFLSILTRFAIPLFFIISGAIYLNKDDLSFKKILKKVINMIIILVLFSFIYYVFDVYRKKETFDIIYFLKTMYSSKIRVNLNYLYYYIAYLLSIPFLQSMVKNLKNKHFYYMIILYVIFYTIPIFEYLLFKDSLSINSNIELK